jgi:DNA-binding LacI/PurR family transcriptional regulator
MARIAELAGVGKMTVSRALTGSGKVSEEKRKRIFQIAEEIGYRRSNVVSTVMSHMARSRSVKYATPLVLLFDSKTPKTDHEKTVYDQLTTGARRKAKQFGFPLEVIFLGDHDMKDSRLDTILETRGIQGLVMNVINPARHELRLSWERLTAVTMGGHLAYPDRLAQVHGDVTRTMNEALGQLLNRGYGRIGFIGQANFHQDFLRLYEASMYLYQSTIKAGNRIRLLSQPERNNDAMVIDWFNQEKPDAIICTHDAPLGILRQIGKEAPRDYGFVCAGGTHFDETVSGVYLNRSLLAEAAIEIVAKNVLTGNFGLPDASSRVLIRGQWKDGETLRLSLG